MLCVFDVIGTGVTREMRVVCAFDATDGGASGMCFWCEMKRCECEWCDWGSTSGMCV